ncbi:MAG: hypothetical protein QE263_09690 [Vampirovibrionales bacterium]|nr:hypothetical protein [Vampirovibrionales bacterium]
MVSPLARFSSSMSTPRMAACSKYPAIGFGNGMQPTTASAPSNDRIINHNIQPYVGNKVNAIGQTGMYFRGSIVGTRLDVFG